MPTVEVSVDINRPLSQVFEFLCDPANELTWRAEIKEVALKSGSPGQVGAVYEEAFSAMGMNMNGTIEIVGIEPGRRIDFRGSSAPINMTTAYLFEEVGSGTRVLIEIDAGLPGKMMAPTMRKQMLVAVARLREVLES